MIRKITSFILLFCFVCGQGGYARELPAVDLSAAFAAGACGRFRPAQLRSLIVDRNDSELNVIVDKGDAAVTGDAQTREITAKLLEYFLVGITLPDNSFWVNLRPDGAGDIIDPLLQGTDVGRIFLEADLALKKDMASATAPATAQGRKYWEKLSARAESLFGAGKTVIPTLFRPWIVPGEIIVRQSGDSAYVYKAVLQVRLEQDRLPGNTKFTFADSRLRELNEYSAQLIRELILPGLTRRINSSRTYAQLRQVFYSLILAKWFKEHFRGTLGRYAERIDSKDLTGLMSRIPWSKDAYFRAYRRSFEDGEYREIAMASGRPVRSYVSGGISGFMSDWGERVFIEADKGIAREQRKRVVDETIRRVMAARAPARIARDYTPGYLLIRDAKGPGGDTREGKIEQALAHSRLATADPVRLQAIREMLGFLNDNPMSDGLSLLQFEGIAQRIVHQFSGNPDAYKEYKDSLDAAFLSVIERFRDRMMEAPDFEGRLKTGLMFAGIANLFDPSHPENMKKIAGELGSGFASGLDTLLEAVYEKTERDRLVIGDGDFSAFFNYLSGRPRSRILYFLDNHGEAVFDQLPIEVLLDSGYRVTAVARAMPARDDVTADEARIIFGSSPYLKEYLETGRLEVTTDGSFLLGADLTQSGRRPVFLKAWDDSCAYIAKGAGNFHTLVGQKLSLPGFHVRMMKGAANAYERLSELKGSPVEAVSPYDMAFVYQEAAVSPRDGGSKGDLGGIDMRGMELGTSRVSAVPFFGQSLPGSLDAQWKDIRLEMMGGDLPYPRIRAYVEECCGREDAVMRLQEVIACIAGMLREQEAQALPTPPELKEVLMQLG